MNESQKIDMCVQEAMVQFENLNRTKPNRIALSRNLFNRLQKDGYITIIPDDEYFCEGLLTSVRLGDDNLIVVSAETMPVIHVMGKLSHAVGKLRRV